MDIKRPDQTKAKRKKRITTISLIVGALAIFTILLAVVFNYTYFFHINIGFSELVFQTELAKLEDQELALDAIDGATPIIKMMTSSTAMIITSGIFAVIGNTVIAVIIAAFCKTRPEVAPPLVA